MPGIQTLKTGVVDRTTLDEKMRAAFAHDVELSQTGQSDARGVSDIEQMRAVFTNRVGLEKAGHRGDIVAREERDFDPRVDPLPGVAPMPR